MKKWLFIFLALLSIVSCRKSEYRNVIPRRDLVPLLVHLHIADAMALTTTISRQFGGLDSAILYKTVLDKYGYTKDDLEQTFTYYSLKPEKLLEIYDDVFSELSKQSEEARKLYSSTSDAETFPIWKPKKKKYLIRGDTASYPPVFDIKIDTTGTFVLSAQIKITPKDESLNPRIVAYFYNPSYDDSTENKIYFEEIPLLKSVNIREYTLLKECNDTSFSRLKIIIPMHDTNDSIFKKDFEMKEFHVALYHDEKKK